MGYPQRILKEYGLTLDEVMILRHFLDFVNTGKMKKVEIEGKTFYWITYKKIIEDLPILNIKSNKSVGNKLNKLVEVGFLEKYIDKTRSGTWTYFGVGDNYEKLIYEGIESGEKQEEEKIEDKNSVENDYKSIIDYLNKKTNKNYRNVEGNKKFIRARYNEGYELEDFFKVIDNMTSKWLDHSWKDKQGNIVQGITYLRPETLFGNKFDSYLNQEVSEQKEEIHINIERYE